jgi:hypothetical protein
MVGSKVESSRADPRLGSGKTEPRLPLAYTPWARSSAREARRAGPTPPSRARDPEFPSPNRVPHSRPRPRPCVARRYGHPPVSTKQRPYHLHHRLLLSLAPTSTGGYSARSTGCFCPRRPDHRLRLISLLHPRCNCNLDGTALGRGHFPKRNTQITPR